MPRNLVALLLLVALAGCGRPEGGSSSGSVAADAPAALRTDLIEAAPMVAPAPPAGNAATAPLPPATDATLIAYSYDIGLELPAAQVIAARDAHLRACSAAGPAQCQLLGSSSNAIGESAITAQLQLRGAPAWLEGFRAGVAADATRLEGRVVSSGIRSEDLTRQVVDTEATLRAQLKLRERLGELLGKHQGKLADLLEVERELARVQGEIDARTSELNVMRKRIAMSDLTISYQSRTAFIDDQTANPAGQALREFLATVSYSFAALIRLVAAVLPWLLLLVPALWLMRRAWKNRAR